MLTFSSAPDFETPTDGATSGSNTYIVQVTATDDGAGTLTDVQTITVTVTDVNEAPSITSDGGGATAAVNAAENQTAVTTVTATDPDADTVTFSITGGEDQGDFSIVPATGVLTFSSAPDFENPTDGATSGSNTYIVQVTATDNGAGTLTDVQTITVTVTDANDPPVITSDGGGATAAVNAAENQTAVTTVTATDPEAGTVTFSITGGEDQGDFSIVPATGVLTFSSAPDFETPTDGATSGSNTYIVQVTATDDGAGTLTDVQTITVTVTDVNEAPSITSDGGGATAAVNAAENQTAVTTVTATDPEAGTVTFSITGGEDQGDFSIVPATGVLTFSSAPDFETPTDGATSGSNTYIVQVTATDDGAGTLTDVQTITVTVTDANDPPVITSDGGGATAAVNAAENQTAVTTVTATDPEADTVTFSITGGEDQGDFSIVPATGVLTFSSAPDFENPTDGATSGSNTYIVQVTATDDGAGTLTDVQTITVTVTDANDAPVITSNGGGAAAAVNAAENQTAVTTVTATDPEADTVTFSITGGEDQGDFSIVPATGVLTFSSAPDFETPTDGATSGSNTYIVQVTATDDGAGTLTDVQTITVTVTDANEAPSITSDGGGATAAVNAAENQTAVTTVTATDPDADTVTFSITGGEDQGDFSIVPATGVLTFSSAPDFENPTDGATSGSNTYIVQVTATDDGAGTLTDVQTITVTVTDANDAPVITSNGGGAAAAVNAAENQTAVTTVTATDPEADTVTFSITGGEDQGDFSIVPATGVLTFSSAPDFETPTDGATSGSNTYIVQVTATDDGAGTLTDVQTITVTVTDVNEAPSITSDGGGATAAVNAAENQTAVTTVTATDPDADTVTFSITGGEDQGDFSIVPATGVLTFSSAPDFETPTDGATSGSNTYIVQVTATDDGAGTLTDVQTITVTVTDGNEPPVITSDGGGATAAVNAAENQTAVTTVTATDPEAGTVTFSITGGEDQGDFSIVPATGVLTFSSAPDFEIPTDGATSGSNTYIVEVTATDDGAGTLTDVQTITVTVTDANDAPAITSDGGGATAAVNAAENQTAVTTVTATDPDADTVTFSITGGEDQGDFSIVPATGVLTFSSAPDFENPTDGATSGSNTYIVQVTATDDGAGTLTDVQTITVTVTDANDAPAITSDGGGATAAVNAAENQTAVTTVTATDPDADTVTFSITGGEDQGDFSIVPATGVLTFSSAPDFETPTDGATSGSNTYIVQVTATDNGAGTLTDVQTITVTVTDANDAPVITSDGGGATAAVNAAENQTAVTTVTATDPDADTVTFSITGGEDQGDFSIVPATGVLAFSSAPDFETPTDGATSGSNTYIVQVTATDNGAGTLTDVQTITVTVTDVNEAPSITSDGGGATASVNAAENQTAVTTVTATDPEADTVTFSITGGEDQGDFSIVPATGVLTFSSAPDFETPTDGATSGSNTYIVEVTATDDGAGTLTDVQTITVTVTDGNDPPVITSDGGGATAAVNAAENQTAVTTVTATDPEADTVTFSITGGEDQGDFSIVPATGVLTFSSAPDFETPTDGATSGSNTYIVQVTATDDGAGTLTDVQTITVTVTDVNDAPVITSDGGGATAAVNAAENQTAVTTVTATDPDADTVTFSITGGEDQGDFSIVPATGVLTFSSAPDFENPTDGATSGSNTYIVEVTATDDGAGTLTDVQTITVTVTDGNDAPSITSNGGGATAAVNAAENQTAVTTVTATDPDADTVTFSITGGEDQTSFSIVSATGVLTFSSAPDFEIPTDGATSGSNTYIVEVTATDNGAGALTDVQTITVTVTDVNEAPLLFGIESAQITYVFGDPATQLSSTINVSDVDNVNIASATVQITSNLDVTDVLEFTNTAFITGTYTAGTGLMSLTGSTTLANYRDALRAVTFRNTNAINPSALTRTVSFQVSDGAANSNVQTRNIAFATPPNIGIAPNPISFGNVTLGSSSAQTVTISNSGGAPLTVTSITSSDAQFVATSPALPFNVGAGGSTAITVTFSPVGGGSAVQNANLTVTSNTGNVAGTNTVVPMSGLGILQITPSSLDFGILTLFSSSTLQLTINNTTGALVTINTVGSSNSQFTNQTPLPLAIPDGTTGQLDISYFATSDGTAGGQLSISYNPTITVDVTGCGGYCDSTPSSSGEGGASEGGDSSEDEPFTVPFGGETYLLILVAGYGIYALSRAKR